MNWIDVKNENDIKKLLNAFGWFHDGCLREIHLWNSYSINNDTMWIASKGIKWRERSEYMGDQLRYGQDG